MRATWPGVFGGLMFEQPEPIEAFFFFSWGTESPNRLVAIEFYEDSGWGAAQWPAQELPTGALGFHIAGSAVMRPSGKAITHMSSLLNSSNGPFMGAVRWIPSEGFGTRYADPDHGGSYKYQLLAGRTPPNDHGYLWSAFYNYGYQFTRYEFSEAEGFGVRAFILPPGGMVGQNSRNITFSPSGLTLVRSTVSNSVNMQEAFPHDNVNHDLGTRWAAPVDPPTPYAWMSHFHPNGDIWVTNSNESGVAVWRSYDWDDAEGFGARHALPPGFDSIVRQTRNFRWNRAGTAMAFSIWPSDIANYPAHHVYAWNAGWGAKFADPPQTGRYMEMGAWTVSGSHFVQMDTEFTPTTNPELAIAWEWSDGFGVKLAAPSFDGTNNSGSGLAHTDYPSAYL